jgi:hypothetical protein
MITSAAFLIHEPCKAIPTSYKTNRGRINKKLLAKLFEQQKYDFIKLGFFDRNRVQERVEILSN